MRQVDEYFSLHIDNPLFHYTGIGSLVGIAKSNTIWASHIYYLNDSKEILHACDVLQEALEPRLTFDNQLTDVEREFGKQFLTWAKTFYSNQYCLFVFSLSEEKSLLSQWRSYTPHGKGVSIGCGPSFLQEVIQINDLKIARCVYDYNEQQQLLYSLFDKLLVTFRQTNLMPDESLSGGIGFHPFFEKFRGNVLQVLAIIKHQAFQEEQEWRLISRYYPSYVVPDIQFREGASLLVPYIELSLGTGRPCFDEVVLGPTPHENLSNSTLSMFLSNKRLCNSTSNSAIPYREW